MKPNPAISDTRRREAIGTDLIVPACPLGHRLACRDIVSLSPPAYYCLGCPAIVGHGETTEALLHGLPAGAASR